MLDLSGSHKMYGHCWLAEYLSTSQEGFCFIGVLSHFGFIFICQK